ncbi:unnamed protein product [Rotaria socialis]|uniref:Uncharacterized protein n=1 Tax=Rotaria socialis TaxID=392032 RepID=A0A820DFQ8_9BILA|nr:unnamed protein product [Rotaria socialis]
MLSTEPYSRRKSSTDELEKSLTQYQSKIFDNEQHSRKPVKTLNGKQNQHEKSRAKNHNRSILKRHNQNELAHGDFIQRAIREGLASGKQRKTSNTSSTNNSYDLNEIFEDENNDWFFEKLFDKFESIRGKTIHEYVESASDDVNNSVTYGPERIIERRYYINKAASLSKRNQLTSTTDLTKYREKTRLISRVSSLTAATTYSRESESSVDIPAGPANTKPTSISRTPPVNSNITSKSPSIAPTLPAVQSTASQNQTNLPTSYQNPCNNSRSSSAASTPTNIKVAARKSSSTESESELLAVIPTGPLNTKPTSISRTPSVNSNITSKSPSVISTLPAVPSVASKNETNLPTSYQNPCSVSGSLSAASTPTNIKLVARKSSSTESESELLAVIPTGPLNTKPPSAPRTPLANNSFVSKSPSITAAQPLNTNVTARSPSIELAPSMTQFIAPKNRSTGSTGSAVLPVVISSPIAPSSIPSAPIPIYENELAYRHALSPRSQIVASSTPVHESSGSSDGSTSPEFVSSVPAKAPTVPRTTLQDNELKALAHYSSQLELSGFTPSVNPVIANPNFSTTFWDSVDHFIANNKATNSVTRLPPVSRPIDRSGYRWNNSVNKVLDKYNLEIKPQEIIESSAPLLMPPLDSLP